MAGKEDREQREAFMDYVPMGELIDMAISTFEGQIMDEDNCIALQAALSTIWEACKHYEKTLKPRYYICGDFYPKSGKMGELYQTTLYPIAKNR